MAELRYYQHDAVVATYRHLREKNTNPCIDVSVGGGKSWIAAQIMSDVVKAWGGRVILLCHVKELLEQDLEKLNILSPDVKSGMYSAGFGRYDTDQPAIVAGIQSVYNKAKLFGHRDICIVDEAHMIQPNDEGMYGRFVDGLREINPKIRFVGMTATPYRLKGGLICQPQNLFNEICYSIGLKELIDKGFLSKLVAKSGKTLANLDNIHVRAGEFVAEEVEAAMMEQRIVASACREIVELTRDRKSVIVFCSSVAHSRTVAQLIAQYSGEECAVVTGDTPAPERAEILHRFKGGSIQTDLFGATKGPLKYVANVECLTTGFDAPNIDCVALLRPTMSPGLLLQMCGRGTRLSPDTGKQDCLILDFANNISRHGCLDQLRPPSEHTGEKRGPLAKACPECQTMMPLPVMTCPVCGYQFPASEKKIRIEAEASTLGVISGEVTTETLEVTDVDYEPWTKRGAPPGAPRTVRVTYWCGLNERHSEWLCPEHTGYARRKFEQWFLARRAGDEVPVPSSVDEFLEAEFSGCVRRTKDITIRRVAGERFPDSIKSTPGGLPESSPWLHTEDIDPEDYADLPF